MATRKTAGSGAAKRTARTTRTAKRTTRGTATSTSHRSSSGRLYPRRRRSRPGLPTTMGTALGTLVVTTLLDLSWPVRITLIVGVLVVGLAYVLWRHRAEMAADGAVADATPGTTPAPDLPAPDLPAPGDQQAPPST